MATKSYLHLGSSGQVMNSPGRLAGFFVGTLAPNGTIVLHDSIQTSPGLIANDPLISVVTPSSVGWYPLPIDLRNGLWADISVGMDVTFANE